MAFITFRQKDFRSTLTVPYHNLLYLLHNLSLLKSTLKGSFLPEAFNIAYLLHNPAVEKVAIHWAVLVFHWQYWVIIGEYGSILSDNIKQMYTACLDGLSNMVIRIIWWNWGQNTLKPSIACLKELQDDKIALTLTLIKLQKNVVKAISSLCLFYHVGSINASLALNLKVAVTLFSSGSRPWDKGGEGRGDWSSRPWDLKGGPVSKKIFQPLAPQFGLKIKAQVPPLDRPLVLSLTLHDRSHSVSSLAWIFIFYLMALKQRQSSKVNGPKS